MNFHGRMINIRDNADDEALSEYKRGHRDARHAAAEIANEADARIAELEAQLAAKDAAMASLQRRLLCKINYWTDYTSGIAAVERTYQRAAESLRALINESKP